MKNVIIPVDFSECSIQTCKNAVKLFEGKEDIKLILFYMYEDAEDEGLACLSFESILHGLSEEEAANIHTYTQQGKNFLTELCNYALSISACMIVTCMSKSARKLIDLNPCPILIIPKNTESNEILRVAITTDLRDVDFNTPTNSIRMVLDLFHPILYIVNVDSEMYITPTEELQYQQTRLAALLSEYYPKFDFLTMYDYTDSINQYVADKKINLVITIPHHHNLLEKFSRPHHTLKLLLGSSVPVLAIHE